MSQEDVQRWREIIEDFRVASSGSSWEGWLASIDEVAGSGDRMGCVRVSNAGHRRIHRGKEAVVRWWRELLAAWQTVEFEYELVDAGDCIVLLLDQRMRGRATGIEVPSGKYAHVARFKDGLMVHWKHYATQSKALEAAGLWKPDG